MAKTWHQRHEESYTVGQRVADAAARLIGSWAFIISQTMVVAAWVVFNLAGWFYHFDPYPFILLNLMFSVQAAYAGPVIMMSQNRQAERDRFQSLHDYQTNLKAEAEIEEIQAALKRIEEGQLARILHLLEGSPRGA